MLKLLKNIASGFALGTAEIIPGVSGGTIALILGCYDELLASINHFKENPKKSLKFLIPLLLGMAAALILLSSLVNYLLERHSLPTMLFFVGLICGIMPLLQKIVREPEYKFRYKPKTVLLALIPVAALIGLSMLELRIIGAAGQEAVVDYGAVVRDMGFPLMAFLLIAGILASCALVMPGVSGSFVLLALGLYHLVIHSVSSITELITDITNAALWVDICKVLAPFGVGVLIGGLSMVRLMEMLLDKHRKAVFSVILGLLFGSVYAIFAGSAIFHSYPGGASGVTPLAIIIGIFTYAAGVALSFTLAKRKL